MANDNLSSLATLVLRVTLGVIFVAHGLQKTFGVFDGSGIEGVSKMLEGMGFVQPILWAWVLSMSELIGGLFLILGIMPRISSALIVIIMGVAIAKIHGPKGFFAAKGGFEFQLLILASSLYILINGGGKFSFFDKY